MKFKEFYMLQERRYFSHLLEKSVIIVDKLERKLKKMPSIDRGTRVEVDGVTFIFYKRGVKKDQLAVYDGNGRIKIYVDNQFGDTENFNFLKYGIPERMRGVLVHELSHMEEDLGGVLDNGMLPKFETETDDYFNSNTEVNARTLEFLDRHLTDHILQLAKSGDVKGAFRILMIRVLREPTMTYLTVKNKKRLLKITYTAFIQLVEDQLGNASV